MMILSQKKIEEIAAAVTKDFNEFFYGNKSEDTRRMARGTPIDQFAKDYLGMNVSFARLSSDGSICGLTAYADTEYIVEELGVKRTIPLRKNQILLDVGFIQYGQVHKLCGKRARGALPLLMNAPTRFCSRWKAKPCSQPMQRNTQPVEHIRSET